MRKFVDAFEFSPGGTNPEGCAGFFLFNRGKKGEMGGYPKAVKAQGQSFSQMDQGSYHNDPTCVKGCGSSLSHHVCLVLFVPSFRIQPLKPEISMKNCIFNMFFMD